MALKVRSAGATQGLRAWRPLNLPPLPCKGRRGRLRFLVANER